MLSNTFCHIPRVSPKVEERLWADGLLSWDVMQKASKLPVTRITLDTVQRHVDESQRHLEQENPRYFADLLPANMQWRLFPEFRHSVAYLDIETTGLQSGANHVTTIALYDGLTIKHYIQGQNLGDFARDIEQYKLLVTYNGKCFDIPFLRQSLGLALPQAHIDLRYVLFKLGYRGGLKGCEKAMGIERYELDGVDGFMAVCLWGDYKKRHNPRALETLLAYNIADVLGLETLLVKAYNLMLKQTPFEAARLLDLPQTPPNPFQADVATLKRLMSELPWHYAPAPSTSLQYRHD
ncbi:MAG TPA: ribonuclease H-like domain-containing protein [bacterium]|jgi:hypothetical protein